MSIISFLQIINYGLVLIFGLLLSTLIAGGWENNHQKTLIILLCPVLLLIQGIGCLVWDVETVTRLYPLIVHAPLILILVLILKKKTGIALVSVCTAYLCCQLPHWVSLALAALTGSALAGEIGYTLVIALVFILLQRFLVKSAHDAMTHSVPSLILFGSLPVAYYIFDYATTVYSNILYAQSHVFSEFLPTILIIFYLIFLTAYHIQEQKRTQSELQRSILENELKQSSLEIESLRRAETQTAIFQHDMRHHLVMVDGYLSSGNPESAQHYIKKILADVSAITPRRYCENETVNLLCSAFYDRTRQLRIDLKIDAKLPKHLAIPETELCAAISNGLDNALHAVSTLDESQKWIDLFCNVRLNKLLIEIRNPYSGTVTMQGDIPVSPHSGHGYGCKSIQAIAQAHQGICTFEPKDGIFTLRIMIPFVETIPQPPRKGL